MGINKIYNTMLSEVNNMLKQGRKRITVLMPTGFGKSHVMGRIIQSIGHKAIVIVPSLTIRKEIVLKKEKLFNNIPVSVITVKDYLNDTENIEYGFDYTNTNPLYVLYETKPSNREELVNYIPIDATVISIGSPFTFKDKYSSDASTVQFDICVFYSENIFDIRDLIIASDSERSIIIAQILEKKNKQDRLLYAIRTIPVNASPEASKEELEALQKQIEERDKVIAEKEETIALLQALLSSVGIPIEEIRESTEIIKRIKYEFRNEESEAINEIIAETITGECQRLFARYVTLFNSQHYSSMIEAKITRNVWDKMNQESKNCLITGKIAFQSMINTGDDSLDYSGVCILASKSLDIEMSKRFFHNYVMYLRRTHPQNKWPNVLFKDNHLLSDEEFTLGSIKYVVGIDKYGMVINRYSKRLFLEYASNELYDCSLSRTGIEHHLQRCIEAVEIVRENYRNPAAHRVLLSRITAKECFDYLVDTYKKLKEILEDMR